MFRVENYFLPQGLSSAPVTKGDYLMGLITLADIVRVPREQWAFTPVGHAMRQLEQVYTASPEQPLLEILEMMNDQNINQVPVVQDGRFVGVLSRESVLRYLQIRQSLSTEKPRYAA